MTTAHQLNNCITHLNFLPTCSKPNSKLTTRTPAPDFDALWKPLSLTVVRTYNLLQGHRIQQRLFFPPTIMLPYVANVKESCRRHEISEQIT